MARIKCDECKVKKDEDKDFYESNKKKCKECCVQASAVVTAKNRVQLKATLRRLVEHQDSVDEKLEKLLENQEKQDDALRQIRKMLKKMSTK
jgi:hypothetical protein